MACAFSPNAALSVDGRWCSRSLSPNTLQVQGLSQCCNLPPSALGNGERNSLKQRVTTATFSSLSSQVALLSLHKSGPHRKRFMLAPRAASQQKEPPPEDGDYALPPLDFEELTQGRASKTQFQIERQARKDAALLDSWDASPMANESTYEMLGAKGGQTAVREYMGWKPVDPSEFLTKIGIFEQGADGPGGGFPAGKTPPQWKESVSEPMERRQVAPETRGVGRRKRPRTGVKKRPADGVRTGSGLAGRVSDKPGKVIDVEGRVSDRDEWVRENQGRVSKTQGAESDLFGRGQEIASVSGRVETTEKKKVAGPALSKGLMSWQALQERPPGFAADENGTRENGSREKVPFNLGKAPTPGADQWQALRPGVSEDSGVASSLPPQEGENSSFEEWDLGLPDYNLVEQFRKEAPVVHRGGADDSLMSAERGGNFGSVFAEPGKRSFGEEGEFAEYALSAEELRTRAAAIEAGLGLRRQGEVRNVNMPPGGNLSGNNPPRKSLAEVVNAENASRIAMEEGDSGKGSEMKKAAGLDDDMLLDDDSLLAQFDQMMSSKKQWVTKQRPEKGVRDLGQIAPERRGKNGVRKRRGKDEWDEEDEVEEEDFGKGAEGLGENVGLVPEARARLAEERRLEFAEGSDEETDSDEEIEEQFIEDPDWQDGWGDDMYMDVDEEIKKRKAAKNAKKKAAQQKGTRDIIDLRRGSEPLAGRLNEDGTVSVEGRLEGSKKGGAARGAEKSGRAPRVDMEKEMRLRQEFIDNVKRRAELRRKGGVKKRRAMPDVSSTWEPPEKIAARQKALSRDTLQLELEAAEKMLETRHERVVRNFSLIDSVVSGSFEELDGGHFEEEDGTDFEDEEFEGEGLAEESARTGPEFVESFDVGSQREESAGSGEVPEGVSLGGGSDSSEIVPPISGGLHDRLGVETRAREQEQERERERERERSAAEASLRMGGLWADLDDEPLPTPSAPVRKFAFERTSAVAPEALGRPNGNGRSSLPDAQQAANKSSAPTLQLAQPSNGPGPSNGLSLPIGRFGSRAPPANDVTLRSASSDVTSGSASVSGSKEPEGKKVGKSGSNSTEALGIPARSGSKVTEEDLGSAARLEKEKAGATSSKTLEGKEAGMGGRNSTQDLGSAARLEKEGSGTTSNGRSGDERDPRGETLLEQLRPPRLRRREEPKEETVESITKGYPELEFTEEIDPETGVVRQVIRHVGVPPEEVKAEERRDAERFAQSLNFERDDASEANLLVDRLLNAGEQVDEMIQQLGREKRLDTHMLRAIDRKMSAAKKNREDQVYETLNILYRYIEAEMERQNATPALRLLDELLQLDDGTLDEATWLRLCRDRMREEFVPESAIDIFNPPGVPKPRADGTWEFPEEEGILRIDFVREIDDILADFAEQQREFAKTAGFTADAIAARLVFEQKMRTMAQLRKLRRNAAMVDV